MELKSWKSATNGVFYRRFSNFRFKNRFLWLVLILFYCYDGTVTTNHLFSLMAIDAGIREAGVLITFKLIDSIIHQSLVKHIQANQQSKVLFG